MKVKIFAAFPKSLPRFPDKKSGKMKLNLGKVKVKKIGKDSQSLPRFPDKKSGKMELNRER